MRGCGAPTALELDQAHASTSTRAPAHLETPWKRGCWRYFGPWAQRVPSAGTDETRKPCTSSGSCAACSAGSPTRQLAQAPSPSAEEAVQQGRQQGMKNWQHSQLHTSGPACQKAVPQHPPPSTRCGFTQPTTHKERVLQGLWLVFARGKTVVQLVANTDGGKSTRWHGKSSN